MTAEPAPWEPTIAEQTAVRELAEELARVRRRMSELQARETELLAAAMDIAGEQIARSGNGDRDLPARSLAAELAAAVRESPRTMMSRMNDAAAVAGRLPRALAALSDGRISAGHVRAILSEADHLQGAEAHARYEERAVELAAASTVAATRTGCRSIAESLARVPVAERHANAASERAVTLRDLGDGLAQLSIVASAVLLQGAYDRLTSMARSVAREHGVPEGDERRPAEARTLAQRRADLALDLLLTGVPAGHAEGVPALAAIRGTVQVTVSARTLIGMDDAAAHLAGHGPIDADIARYLAREAPGWERLFRHPDTGALLTVDHYSPTAAQRRYLQARDEHCRFPGCRQPAHRSDLDHVVDHARGGPTTVENLQVLCRGHHSLKHHSPWRVTHDGGGVLTWTSPLGRRYTGTPEPTVRFLDLTPEAAPAEYADAPF